MSEDNSALGTCCASCGIAEIDGIKLRECDGCDLVRYCSDAWRELHRPEHAAMCKKRAAELRDELLFKQPESSHHGDCPICSLPLSLDLSKSSTNTCCSKVICKGCVYANRIRAKEMNLFPSCPFCRQPVPNTEREMNERRKIRSKANDPAAISFAGLEQREKGNYGIAFANFTKAAELGHVEAHRQLSIMYELGLGVEQDEGKAIHHLEEAAIGGHPKARHNLGVYEWNDKNYERAAKHWIIAARLGYNESIKELMKMYKVCSSDNFERDIERAIEKAVESVIAATQEQDNSTKALVEKYKEKYKTGFVSKEVLDATLRAHKAAVDATKSPQREAAERRFALP